MNGILLTLFLVAASFQAQAEIIEVFATEGRITIPKQSKDLIIIYDAKAPERLEAILSKNLPADPEQAKRLAMARLALFDHARLDQLFSQAYQFEIKSVEYQLERYPAIVFGRGKAVIYGETDIGRALTRYQAYKKIQREQKKK